MKIAIVHDYLNQYGGAERVVEVLHEIFPNAPIYTSLYLPECMPESFRHMDIRTSFMQKLPFLKKHFKKYLLLYPLAIESFNFSEYDVILSSSSGWAKGARHGKNSLHICFCYTPMRWVWDYNRYIGREGFSLFIQGVLQYCVAYLKHWDLRTNSRVDDFIAISHMIKDRIFSCYQRASTVIYPPVETGRFRIANQTGDFFLVVSRLNSYKRIDLVIEAFNALNLPLVVIGDGPYRKSLEKMAKPNIRFLGKVSDAVLKDYYSTCRAFIFSGEEDFGLAPVEAMASGRPVIAYAAGGALETVINGVTGVFFPEQTVESLVAAVQRCLKIRFSSAAVREHALAFDKDVFKKRLLGFIEARYAQFRRQKALDESGAPPILSLNK